MEFWISVIETIIKAIFIIAVACGGVFCGKNLKARKNAKSAQEKANVNNAK